MRHGESELNLLFRAGKVKWDSLDIQDSPFTSLSKNYPNRKPGI